MSNANQTFVKQARRKPSLVSGAISLGIAGFYLATSIFANDDNLAVKSMMWLGLCVAFFSLFEWYKAYRRFPTLRVDATGIEVENFASKQRWYWRQTGPFSLSPEPGTSAGAPALVAMRPDNVDAYESASNRPSPDFIDADIAINLMPYFGDISEAEEQQAARALLELVRGKRAEALQRLPMEMTYTGPASRSRLQHVLRMRRIRSDAPIVVGLLFFLYFCCSIALS